MRTVLRNLPSGQNSKQYTWLVNLPGRRDEQRYFSTLTHEQIPEFGLGRQMTGELEAVSSGEV